MKKYVIIIVSVLIVITVAFGTYYLCFKSAYNDMPEIAKSKVVIQLSKEYKKNDSVFYADKKNLSYSISKVKSGYIVEIGGYAIRSYSDKKFPLYAKVKFDNRCNFEKIEELKVR